MFDAGSISSRLGLDTTPYAKGLTSAADNARAFQKQFTQVAEKMKMPAVQTGGLLKQLKAGFGEESGLGLAMKTMAGAGAVAGISMIGNAVREATGKAVELRDAFNAGKISAAELPGEIAKSLPIVGGFASGMENVLELFTGAKAAAAALTAEAKAQDMVTESLGARMKAVNQLWSDTRRYVAGVSDQIKEMSLSGLPLQVFKIDQSLAKELDEIRARIDQFKGGDAMAKMGEDAAKLRAQLAATPRTVQDPNFWQRQLPNVSEVLGLGPNEKSNHSWDVLSRKLKTIQNQMHTMSAEADKAGMTQMAEAARLAVMQKGQALVGAGGDWMMGGLKAAGEHWEKFKGWMEGGTEGIKAAKLALADLDKQLGQQGMTEIQKRIEELMALGATAEMV